MTSNKVYVLLIGFFVGCIGAASWFASEDVAIGQSVEQKNQLILRSKRLILETRDKTIIVDPNGNEE